MKETVVSNLAGTCLKPLSHAEMLTTNGGGLGDMLLDAALFVVSPALGLFHLGVKSGYDGAAKG